MVLCSYTLKQPFWETSASPLRAREEKHWWPMQRSPVTHELPWHTHACSSRRAGFCSSAGGRGERRQGQGRRQGRRGEETGSGVETGKERRGEETQVRRGDREGKKRRGDTGKERRHRERERTQGRRDR
jgi:hypothetical protein